MDINAVVKNLSAKLGPPKSRAAFGTWPTYAWVVRGLVERGYGVTAAVKQVLESTGHGNNEQAFGSLRAAYYHIKTAEWPAEFSNAAAGETAEFE